MPPLNDLLFAIIGVLMLAVYIGGVAAGGLPEVALLVAAGGGVAVGLLGRAALQILASPSAPSRPTAPGSDSGRPIKTSGESGPEPAPVAGAPTTDPSSTRVKEGA
ncbi:MAG: hypothetical protein IRY83_06240 [Chloroflexi bacterium]|nr:hypothetical protein [Chloroflexota bacterium]